MATMTPVQAVRRHILPPQVTPLERAVDQATPRWDALADAVEPASMRDNAGYQPWLAMQWQVAQFAPYFGSVDALLTAGIPWLMQRGNAASVRRVLSWLGYDGVTIEEDGALLHIDLGRLVTHAALVPVAHVVRASVPAHVKFWRVYHGYDLRPVWLDRGPSLDAGLLDNDSGTPVEVSPYGEPIKASQGQRLATLSDAPQLAAVLCAQLLHITSIATYADRMLLDAWVLDSELLADTSLGITDVITTLATPAARYPPQVVPPASVRTTISAWLAPAPQSARLACHIDVAPRVNDDSRTWTGTWDSQPWRPYFETRTTEITEE